MARFSLALNAGTVLIPGQSVLKYQFTPVGVAGGDVGTDMTNINTSLGTLISTIGSGTGSTQAVALQALVNIGTNAAASDIVVSVNSANITTVTELRRAFDRLIDLAKGGVGGLTP